MQMGFFAMAGPVNVFVTSGVSEGTGREQTGVLHWCVVRSAYFEEAGREEAA